MPTRFMRTIITVLVGLGLAFALSMNGGAQGKRKVAMILPGTIQDADFNTLGYVALQEVGKSLDVQVSHSENVAVADAERVSREYITSGYDIIAYHGGQFPTIMKKLAAQYPNVVFIQEASGKMADFIVLNANPLDNIRNTRQINSVYLRGARLDRDALLAKWKRVTEG